MINVRSGDIDKDHTTNPVPFLLIANEFKFPKSNNVPYLSISSRVPTGVVSDIAPSILELFDLPKPAEMTGVSLFNEIDEVPKKH
jgi:bisphosphoglycerate-independent phosphoglycerate mutase (AlkP superfamily)